MQEKLQKSEFMLIFVDVMSYLKNLVKTEEFDARISSFLARWRKLLMSDMIEEFGRGEIKRRSGNRKRFGREFDDSQQQEMLDNAQRMIDELLLKYPNDNNLQTLKARIHEQLGRY